MNAFKYLALSLVTPSLAFAFTPTYSLTDLGLLPGTDQSFSAQLNNSGEAIGTSSDNHGVLFHKGKVVDLVPTAVSSGATGINQQGQVTGWFSTQTSPTVGFLYYKRKLCTFTGPSTSTQMFPESLNDLGQISGEFSDSGNNGHVFIRQPNGAFSDLGVFGNQPGTQTINNQGLVLMSSFDNVRVHTMISRPGSQSLIDVPPLASNASVWPGFMNQLGVVIGSAAIDAADTHDHAYIYFNGKMKDLGLLPGGEDTWGNGINNLNQTCGEAFTAPNISVAWVNVDGKMRDLNGLLNQSGKDWHVFVARSINDFGKVLCDAQFKGGFIHAVELTPNCVLPNLVP